MYIHYAEEGPGFIQVHYERLQDVNRPNVAVSLGSTIAKVEIDLERFPDAPIEHSIMFSLPVWVAREQYRMYPEEGALESMRQSIRDISTTSPDIDSLVQDATSTWHDLLDDRAKPSFVTSVIHRQQIETPKIEVSQEDYEAMGNWAGFRALRSLPHPPHIATEQEMRGIYIVEGNIPRL